MKELVIEAVQFAVSVEKSCYDFYRRAALAAQEQKARQIFEQLARQEAQHLDAMRDGSQTLCCEPQPNYRHEGIILDFDNSQGKFLEQLRLCLLNKYSVVNLYLALSRCFKEPSVSMIFEAALAVARQELTAIRQHYLHSEPLTSSSVIRRPRRTHTRGGMPSLQPNKHSQLYFSMLDSGRQSHLG